MSEPFARDWTNGDVSVFFSFSLHPTIHLVLHNDVHEWLWLPWLCLLRISSLQDDDKMVLRTKEVYGEGAGPREVLTLLNLLLFILFDEVCFVGRSLSADR